MPIPRFRCRICRKGFSSQTFRIDYCDRRPQANAALLRLLSLGMSLRKIGRILDLDPHSVQHKARKLKRQQFLLHAKPIAAVPFGRPFRLEDVVTRERRSLKPLTIATA